VIVDVVSAISITGVVSLIVTAADGFEIVIVFATCETVTRPVSSVTTNKSGIIE
jgi:hypothetical protein